MSRRLHALLGAVSILAAVFAGCASERPRPAAAPATPPPAAQEPEPEVPPGSLSRRRVDAALKEGPPWLLSRVEVEEVLRKGAFVGWRVVRMPAGWEGAGVRPGDVVTRVNGLALEKPDDLFAVWTAVAGAKELRIAYERDGEAEELAMPIVGEPEAATKAELERAVPEPQPRPVPVGPGAPRETVIIRGSAQEPVDSVHY
jgi:hypothetical protein